MYTYLNMNIKYIYIYDKNTHLNSLINWIKIQINEKNIYIKQKIINNK
jgi:hypothetical protein